MSVPHLSAPVGPAIRAPRLGARPRRSLLVMAAIAALLALVGASCKQLDPNNRPTPVPGVTNGNLPMAYLAATAGGCIVYDEAVNSLNAMIAQAAKDGVKLNPISCYRDYAGQVVARNGWCAKGACQMAAVPGTSNHGWGKAVDFRDQGGELTFTSAGYTWMKAHAGDYGWLHPKSMEQGGSIPVHVYVDGKGYAITADQSRPDVNAAFPLYVGAQHGFSASFPATPGAHTVCVYAINVSGTGNNVLFGCRPVTVLGAAGAVSATAVAGVAPAPAPATTVAPITTTTPTPAAVPSTTATTSTVVPSTSTTSAAAQAQAQPIR